jgi:hypothetical protein
MMGCIRWRNSKDIGAGCLYVESKWAEIIEPDCISKAREWVKITDFGRANGNDFTLNKPINYIKTLIKLMVLQHVLMMGVIYLMVGIMLLN